MNHQHTQTPPGFAHSPISRTYGLRDSWLYKGAGVAMIIMGVAIMTGQLSRFAYWLLGTFPFLATIG
jgi:cytochrome c-type biogenesis protein